MVRRSGKSGPVPDEEQLVDLRAYCQALAKYNEHTNLVSRADPETLVLEHILDAWAMVPIINRLLPSGTGSLVDIGSGAGLPGVILAIACRNIKVVLVESVSKKCRFLQQVVEDRQLASRVEVLNQRAELMAGQPIYRNSFNVATARAVGTIDLIAEMAVPLLVVSGHLLAPKSSRQIEVERARAEIALPVLGAELEDIISVDPDVVDKEHVVLVVKKLRPTPQCYPRTAAQIKRRPLGSS